MIMSGIIIKLELTSEYPLGIPNYYNPQNIPTIECKHIVWFDEVYMEQYDGPVIRSVSAVIRMVKLIIKLVHNLLPKKHSLQVYWTGSLFRHCHC